jgi:hypothetical protein
MKTENTNKIKDTGFTIPKDYFKNFEDSILSEAKLNSIANTSGFRTPDAYFENLEAGILSQVSEKDNHKVMPLFNKRNLFYVASIAATILLLFNLTIFERKSTWDSLDAETVENYLINENIGAYEIASTLENIDFSEENFTTQQVHEGILETYLLENIDIEDLIIE